MVMPCPGVMPCGRPSTRPPADSPSPGRRSGPTPARSRSSSYAVGKDGVRRSAADYSYGYGRALADGVVRPVIFLSYSGQMRWRTRAGDEVSAALGEPLTKDLTAAAWRTALDAQGNWIPQVLAAADQRLTEVRRGVPDAAGLVIATDQVSARAYAAQLRRITGRAPVVVLSDEPGSSARIAEFSAGEDRWMVAVRMVSEGVDVPRLSVGVYATSAATPLYFAQAVGRFVRARRRGETASVFLPSVPVLLQHAAEMEVERDHALDRSPGEDEQHLRPRGRAAGRGQPGPGRPAPATSWSSRRSRPRRPSTGCCSTGASSARRRPWGPTRRPTTSACRGCSSRTRSRPCCRPGRARTGRPAAGSQRPLLPRAAAHRAVPALRKELNGLVAAWHHRTGIPHGAVHTELRQACGGPLAAQATAEQLQARIDLIRAWALRRR